MPVATANGKKFNFPEGTTPEQMAEAIDEYFAGQQPEITPPANAETQPVSETRTSFFGSNVIEPALTVASGLVSEPLAGLSGLVQGGDAGAVQSTREALTYKPRTESGMQGLQTLGDLVQKGIDIANIPLSGLGGLAELIAGQGVDKAVETIGNVQQQGTSKALGGRVYEATGSPLAATIAETTPTALMSIGGLKTKAGAAPTIGAEKADDIQRILEAGKKANVPVLTSDIFTPQTIVGRLNRQFAERIPGFGTGGKRGAQQTARINALIELDESIPKVQAADIFDDLNKSANKFKRAAGQRISTITQNMDNTGQPVPLNRSFKEIDSALDELTRLGKVKDEALIKEVQGLRSTLEEAPQTFSSLREFRSDVRAIAEKVDPTGRSQLRSSDKVRLDNIYQGVTDDLDSFVLKNTSDRDLSRYKIADKVYAEEARKLTKSRLKNVLDKGDVNPELVNNLLYSSSPSQVKLLYKNLNTSGRQNARMALYRKSLDESLTKGELSPEKFVSQLNKMSTSFDVFFKGADKAELDGMKRLLESTGRASESGVVTPTGQTMQASAAAGVIAGAALADPKAIATLLTAGTLGTANKIYESAGVRNLLIRLGKAPKRSTLEADLLRSIPLVIGEANRSLQESTQEAKSR